MQRLTTDTLPAFRASSRISLLLFGAPEGEATMRQAMMFAETWADHGERAAFGYVDAFENIAAARAFGVRVLPTTCLILDGDVATVLEGVHESHRLAAAIASVTAPRAQAA